jgi:uncharacterized protein
MLVRIHSIPEEGMDLSFVIPPAEVKTTFPKGDEASSYFDREVSCEVHLDLNHKDVYLSGKAQTSLRPVCSRCLERYERALNVDLSITCSPTAKVPHGADYNQESDEGVHYYRREQLNLSEIVREQVLLALPIKYLCNPACKGLCPGCGANLNEGEHACKKAVPLN